MPNQPPRRDGLQRKHRQQAKPTHHVSFEPHEATSGAALQLPERPVTLDDIIEARLLPGHEDLRLRLVDRTVAAAHENLIVPMIETTGGLLPERSDGDDGPRVVRVCPGGLNGFVRLVPHIQRYDGSERIRAVSIVQQADPLRVTRAWQAAGYPSVWTVGFDPQPHARAA